MNEKSKAYEAERSFEYAERHITLAAEIKG